MNVGTMASVFAWHLAVPTTRHHLIPCHPTASDVYIQFFLGLFPREWLIDVVITHTNKVIIGEALSLGEFLLWIGLQLIISAVDGSSHHEFWCTSPVDMFTGAPSDFPNT